MRFSTIFAAAAALVGVAVAEDHIVVVGNNSLEFFPNSLSAKAGDTVTFRFWPKNHSVVQSTFAAPCKPMDGGIWSGFIPSSSGASQDNFRINIQNDSTPIWFYCSQGQHCQGGMVGVINPPSGKTQAAFKMLAANQTQNLSPSTAMSGGSIVTNSAGAASGLEVSSVAFTGIFGMLAYLMM